MYYSINKRVYLFRILFKLMIAIASLYGVIRGAESIHSLTYFTQQSNLFLAFVMLIFAYVDFQLYRSNGRNDLRSNTLYIIKFMATISITVTLFVFAFILAPTFDSYYIAYFGGKGTSFYVHLLAPVLAITDFFLFDDQFKSKFIHVLYAIVPALCYVIFILIMNLGFHYYWGTKCAPYNFLNYGAPCGWFGFQLGTYNAETIGIGVFYMIIILMIIFIGIGIVFLTINRKLHIHTNR